MLINGISSLSLQDTPGLENLKRTILKRYNDLDYDSFVGLMGRRGAGKLQLCLCVLPSINQS